MSEDSQNPNDTPPPFVDHHTIHIPVNAYVVSSGRILQDTTDQLFVGRKKFIKDFTSILRTSRFSSGSYLVSGFRGVGKTRAVEKVMEDYTKGNSKAFKDAHARGLVKVTYIFGLFIALYLLYPVATDILRVNYWDLVAGLVLPLLIGGIAVYFREREEDRSVWEKLE